MLNCVYHPVDEMRVVDDAEREELLATGVWFDLPTEAARYREEIEKEVKAEMAEEKPKKRGRPKKMEKES